MTMEDPELVPEDELPDDAEDGEPEPPDVRTDPVPEDDAAVQHDPVEEP